MVRFVLLIAALFGLSAAQPAAAQSLDLLRLPVIYVHKPVVQPLPGAIPAIWPAPPTERLAAIRPDVRRAPPAYAAPVHAPQPAVAEPWHDYSSGLAQYGPFRVLDATRVALVGETDGASPRWFRAMLRDHPGLRQLDMVECPGTRDDRANMEVGRLIRAAGLVIHVPAVGSVRSGAVELLLAGTRRSIAEGAEFAVHSWRDEYGREAADFAPDSPENRAYLDYYREMGMSERKAQAFYAMTNSVPHRRARWLSAGDMRGWIGGQAPARQPRITYASVTIS